MSPSPADVRLRIDVPEEALHTLRVSITVPAFADLAATGVGEHLRRIYGPLLTGPFEGSDESVTIDTRDLGGAAPGELAMRVALLRRHIVAWPYLRLMATVGAGGGASAQPFVFNLRRGEPVYLLPKADRLVVVYHLQAEEATDRALARLVAAELTEANRTVNNGPPCTWSERDQPAELRGLPGGIAPVTETTVGYLTFTLLAANHFKSESQRKAAASHLAMFRPFLAYHIKAAKSYLHARMRSRVEGLQKVLNRAIPADEFAAEGGARKLASGKAFVRKEKEEPPAAEANKTTTARGGAGGPGR